MTTTTNETAATTIDTATIEACAIARGELEPPIEPCGTAIFAQKDYNSRGSCREHWFRLRWNGSSWNYAGERLPSGNFRASERRATSRADVYAGDLTVTHDRGKGLDAEAHLVVAGDRGRVLVACPVVIRRDGNIRITLPDGSEVVRPNPRKGAR